MNNLFTHCPQVSNKKFGTEPSLFQILTMYYSKAGYTLKESEKLAKKYIDVLIKDAE